MMIREVSKTKIKEKPQTNKSTQKKVIKILKLKIVVLSYSYLLSYLPNMYFDRIFLKYFDWACHNFSDLVYFDWFCTLQIFFTHH